MDDENFPGLLRPPDLRVATDLLDPGTAAESLHEGQEEVSRKAFASQLLGARSGDLGYGLWV